MDLFKDIIPSLTSKKNYLFEGDIDSIEKQYEKNAFMVNRAMSQHLETIFDANEMNIHFDLDPKLQYDYYFHAVEKKSYYGKWAKGEKDDVINIIVEVYNVSANRAREYIKLLTEDDIKQLKEFVYKGGKK